MQDPMTVEKIMNSDPAIASKTNEVNEIDNKITQAKQDLQNLTANVTDRYKGTGASKATINARVMSESRDMIDNITLLEAQRASASTALTTLITNAKDNYAMARQSKLDAEESYWKNYSALQQLAQMGMQADELEYKKTQDAIQRDISLMQYYQNREDNFTMADQNFQRDLYKTQVTQEFQREMDDRGFAQQKELAQMGYQNQYNMANLGFDQDVQKMMLQYDLTDAKEQKQFKQELIK